MSQKILIGILVTLIIGGSVGGGTWYYMDQKARNEKQNFENQISDLRKQIEDLENKEKDTVAIPIISFTPDTFTKSEKNEFLEKIVNPFVDYHNMIDNPDDPIAYVGIEKNGDAEFKESGYLYQINYVTKKLGWGGWLQKSLTYWVPECMDECKFTDEFEKKHPKTVEEYNKINK